MKSLKGLKWNATGEVDFPVIFTLFIYDGSEHMIQLMISLGLEESAVHTLIFCVHSFIPYIQCSSS